ncbi:serine hydrolase domain-containing protein [Microbacterium sp. NPDC077663]|uniref:serine hydrolase domain-containing protein n=1 Tax=Microbacterium sp. NPDC077663 TaxID=3364189 RepID=UPI0037CCBF3B
MIAATVRDAITARVAASGFRARGVHVRVGSDEAVHRWTPDTREDIHSVSKGVCVLAAAMAADEGLLSFDTPIVEYLEVPEVGSGTELVTLRHLLTMTTGVDFPWSETLLTDHPDLAVEYLRRPSRGRQFQYSNASTYTAMRVLHVRVGDIPAFLEPRLWEPLGIRDVTWDRCPRGFIAAGGGLHLRTEELARVGRLIGDRGVWGEQRLLSAEWIDLMHTQTVVAGTGPSYSRYGLAGWGGPGAAWRLHGAYGQLVIFAGNAVVTVTADDHDGADAMAEFIAEQIEDL